MFSSIFVAAVLAATAVKSDPTPSEPGPGSVYNEGSTCHIAWDPDTSGAWKVMNIELMSGSNTGMVHITTVATVDGTNASNATFDYPCPQVTPNSAIYFYQFTSPSSTDTLWTTRFAIADASGTTTPPENDTEPNGDNIPWGIGALVDPSQAVPAPSKGTSTSVSASGSASASSTLSVSGASANPSAGSGSSSSTSAAPSSLVTVTKSSSSGTSSGTGTHSALAATNTTGASTANANGAAGLSMSSRLTQAATTLGVVAAAFAVLL